MSQPTATAASSSTATAIPIPAADGYKIHKPYNAKAQARDCCNCIFFLIFALALACAVPAVTRALIYLQPGLPAVAVISSAVTVRNVSDSLITASWDVTFTLSNPNDRGFFYERLVAYAAGCGGAASARRIANVTLPPFRQAGRAAATLSASFPSLKFVVNDCAANRTILRPCAPAPLSLQVEPAAVYERWTWPWKGDVVVAECDVKEVAFRPRVTKLELGPASCRSDGRWRRLEVKCRSVFWNYVYVAGMCLAILAFSL
ncbi:unnamed protein product [Linum tenue]|uniref:Late embryogenesis abundant protein LEA-2 subgroup domain-containing protein n=1 Tax=Linum tenue TaxID=586396 RepID=A0AAV0QES0_9ROSI|nr:unnamed protein product [Linum tenue]